MWKDYYNPNTVAVFAEVIAQYAPGFDRVAFARRVLTADFTSLALKQRTNRLVHALKETASLDFAAMCPVLLQAAPHFDMWRNLVLTGYVETYGLKSYDLSMRTLRELTKQGTAEFAVRPFIAQDTPRALRYFSEWLTDTNEHVRRLVAEGTRPRGVWTMHLEAFKADPLPVLKLLEQLKDDPSLYVRRAVANNLNDISKDNPAIVRDVAVRWLRDASPERAWIVKHACRSMIKKGDKAILAALGFKREALIRVGKLTIAPKRISIGESVRVSSRVESTGARSQKLVIDYAVIYRKAKEKSSRKVFKQIERTLRPGESVDIAFTQKFADLSTRKHYPGEHRIELLVNGTTVASGSFRLDSEG